LKTLYPKADLVLQTQGKCYRFGEQIFHIRDVEVIYNPFDIAKIRRTLQEKRQTLKRVLTFELLVGKGLG